MAIPSTLLQLINRSQDELGQDRSSIVVAATDPDARQFLAFANAEGFYLMRKFDWSFLQTVGTITTVAGTSDYNLASDFDRFIPETVWDRTNQTRLLGPDIPAINRAKIEGTIGVGIQKYYRRLGSQVRITPTPDAVTTIAYEYVSNKWARSSGSTAQTEFLVDTDTSLFNPYLLICGIKWRWRSSKGVDAIAARIEYDDMREELQASDNGGQVIDMGRSPNLGQFMGVENVPDHGYGS